MAEIIDGKALAALLKEQTKAGVADFEKKYNRRVKLAVVMVGDNAASAVYVKNKIRACEFVGIESLSFNLPSNATQKEVEELVSVLAADNSVDGILVQLPLPETIDEKSVLALIPNTKDVDGFSEANVGRLMLGEECISACTPSGIIEMLKSTGVELSGKNAVVIGRSNIVGKPTALLLLKENCTVTVCHSKTQNIKDVCKNADILVAAIGRAGFVTADFVKEGAIVIDVGINRTENGLKGDVDFEEVSKKASYISPVPGGVGPMTIACLMKNAYLCALGRENGRR